MNLRRNALFVTMLWCLAFLIVFDVAIGRLFRYPDDNHVEPSLVVRYFDYGRSVESKLLRMLGSSDADAAPIVAAGWIDQKCIEPIAPPATGRLGITSYGMSFSDHVATLLAQMDPTMAVTMRSGPSASLNHSYACFRSQHDAGHDANKVQIIGVLASSVDRMLTLTGMTTSFEAPMPYTFPRYEIDARGNLESERPTITNPEQLRDPAQLHAFFDQLKQDDRFYDPLLMKASIADHSVLIRLLRRAYAQHETTERHRRWIGTANEFTNDPQVQAVMSAMLVDFAKRVRADGQIPIVLLLQDRPGIDSLYRLLGPGLEHAGIPFISTHQLVPTTDPSNFVSDGHFTTAKDHLVAEHTLALIRSELARQDGRQPPPK